MTKSEAVMSVLLPGGLAGAGIGAGMPGGGMGGGGGGGGGGGLSINAVGGALGMSWSKLVKLSFGGGVFSLGGDDEIMLEMPKAALWGEVMW